MSKEIPILLSTEMVKSTLADLKTQTRRTKGLDDLINVTPDEFDLIQVSDYKQNGIKGYGAIFKYDDDGQEAIECVPCPYGQPGDLLWVRETWAKVPVSSYRQSKGIVQMPIDENFVAVFKAGWDRSKPGTWKPSIHMPKAAARIWLQITDIRVERLQDITEEDAKAEGAPLDYYGYGRGQRPNKRIPNHKCGFTTIWSKINGFDSWQANPWVWVISFNVLSKTGRPKPPVLDEAPTGTVPGISKLIDDITQ